MFFIRNVFLDHSGMHFIWRFLFCLLSTNTLVVKTIRTPIHEWSKRHNLYQTVITKVSDNKPFVQSKQSLPQRNLCAGCQLNSYQVLRLLCWKGHVRARGSTLWRYRWQEASEFLCNKTPLFGGIWATKKIAKKTRKCLLRHATTFSKFQEKPQKSPKTDICKRRQIRILVLTILRFLVVWVVKMWSDRQKK